MKSLIQKRKWITDFDGGWEDSQIFEHRVATTLVQSRWPIEVAAFDGNKKGFFSACCTLTWLTGADWLQFCSRPWLEDDR